MDSNLLVIVVAVVTAVSIVMIAGVMKQREQNKVQEE